MPENIGRPMMNTLDVDDLKKKSPVKISTFDHRGTIVKVIDQLRGLHREHSLCWQNCQYFLPGDGSEANCHIARSIQEIEKRCTVVLPVWECPKYEPKD